MNSTQLVADSVLGRSGLRLHEIADDTMTPTLKAGDVVLVKPAHDYIADGLYLVGDSAPRFYRVASRVTSSDLSLMSDNERYAPEVVTREWFREHVLGIAVYLVSQLGLM